MNILVKEQLSKLLASENLNIEHANVQTASFNVQTRTLTLPTWSEEVSNDLYDLLISHEVGHALYTPTEKLMDSFSETAYPNIKHFINVVEDSRIERMIKDKFPGLKKNYYIGYRELVKKDFFNLSNLEIDNLPLIDRLNLNEKIGNFTPINFSESEKKFVKLIQSTKSYDDVVVLSKILYAYAKEEFEKQNELNEDIEDINEGYSEDSIQGKNLTDGGENNTEDTTQDTTQDTLEHNQNVNQSGSSENFSSHEYIPQAKTQENFEKNINKLNTNNKVKSVYLQFPEINYKDYIIPIEDTMSYVKSYSNNPVYLKGIRKNNKKSVDYMIKLFEMKKSAHIYVRNKISKTGIIDTNKIHSYNYNEDIFKRITTSPEGKNHGLILLLDWSGSMHNKIEKCYEQVMSVISFCKKMNIPFRLLIFGCILSDPNVFYGEKYLTHLKQLNLKNFELYSSEKEYALYEILNSNMSKSNFEQVANIFATMIKLRTHTHFKMNGTPLIEACHVIDNYIPDFKLNNKIEICNIVVITDGVCNSIGSYYYNNKNKPYTIYQHIFEDSDNYVRDTTNKKLYKFTDTRVSLLSAKLQAIKDKHKCNIIGFFIGEGYFTTEIINLYVNDIIWRDNYKKSMKKNKSVTLNGVGGFDEYHLIAYENISQNVKLDVKNNTTRSLTSAFNKFLGRKSLHKVVLNKFVEKISKQVS